ncbi:hypothetical protein HZ326_10687 [Fusarium oxysporum f. sp. albedinis]|nr:hypothetical protein HZ326_10687 [Fusarium oxysporum f. sp. albedinis]
MFNCTKGEPQNSYNNMSTKEKLDNVGTSTKHLSAAGVSGIQGLTEAKPGARWLMASNQDSRHNDPYK